jgi:hypothetical protein
MKMNISTVATVAIFLFSCAGAGNAQQDLSSIKRVTIDSEVTQPEIPLIQSPGNFKAFMIAGGIGAAVDQQEAGKAFREYMRKNNIDVSRIVLESFKRAVQEDKIFELADNSDARLKLVINTYGFGASGFFGGNERKPLLNVTASLVSNGNVVWKKTDFITNLSSATTAYTYDQLGENPQLTIKSLDQISGLLSRQILSDLKK